MSSKTRGIVFIATMFLVSLSTHAETHVVEISGFVFKPAVLEVKPGDTVEWKNLDIVPHTATAKDGSWDTGEILPGASGRVEIGDSFSLPYYCIYHPSMLGNLEQKSGY